MNDQPPIGGTWLDWALYYFTHPTESHKPKGTHLRLVKDGQQPNAAAGDGRTA